MKTFKQFMAEGHLSPIPVTKSHNKFHGNFGGKGNKGGKPVDALDAEFQKHDTGYHYSKKPRDIKKHDSALIQSTHKLAHDKTLPVKTRIKARLANAYFRVKKIVKK